jgi:inhibitor of cysteine peptidase
VKSTKQLISLVALLALLALVVAACTGTPRFEPGAPPLEPTATPGLDRPVSSEDPTPEPGPTPDMEKVIVGEATVEDVEVLILESFPVQVHARITGYLGDGCTEVGEIRQWREENTLYVTIGTVRPADAVCIMVLLPLETSVPLEVHGLPAGAYTVDVHGVTTTFKLDVDNVLAPGSGEETAAVEAARAALAQAEQVAETEIVVREVTAVEWSNACLGAAAADEMCAEVITPGYKVVLAWDGAVYTYHTNWDGSQMRLAESR